jgi:Arc/MetJ-type ribon-helix-helix transcriptional regulator
MASPLTLRLKKEIRERITRIARRKKVSVSEAVRQAIEDWAEREEPTVSAYELMEPYIGVVRGGDPTRSEGTGRRLAELLKSRKNRS